jgi:cytochrome c peroxidase
MNGRPFFAGRKPQILTRVLAVTLCLALALPVFTVAPAMAAPGGIITNGTSTGITTPGFLFEPEVPFDSLKSVPIWNELEQLLDNPYLVTPDPSTPGNDQGFPSYRATGVTRRPSFGVTLPALLVHPLNHNPTTGEEMRLLNPGFPGKDFAIPEELVQCGVGNPNQSPDCPNDPNTWMWTYKTVHISAPTEAEISYNAPFKSDVLTTCITTTEAVPPEGSIICGGDPGEPNYAGFGVLNLSGYSTPAIPLAGGSTNSTVIPAGARLFDPERGVIQPRNPGTGAGGLRKPSLRVPPIGTPNNPGFLINTDPNNVTPSNENDYVRDRSRAMQLGKALFWDMQVGSDGVQSCGTCHFNGTGTDSRTKNQLNPNHLGGDLTLQLPGADGTNKAANQELTLADFPFRKLANPEIAADPLCTSPITASVNGGVLENNFPGGVRGFVVCNAGNKISDVNDVASSMGVVFSPFTDIAPIGQFQPANNGVKAVMPDLRTAGAIDPIPVFQGLRRVEPRNTPTMQAAGFNFDNFWDGRARHDFNGGSVFGASDPQTHVFVNDPPNLTATRQIIRFASIASLATGPGLSEFEMSFAGRNWSKIGKKLLQGTLTPSATSVTPLANQLVDPTDSIIGPLSNQGGSECATLGRPTAAGKPGLCTTYQEMIQKAFYPRLWQNTSRHLNGTPAPCLSAVNGVLNPPGCDPFDGYVLSIATGPADPSNTNQFTQMEANFSLFWGLAVHLWVQILVPDNTPFDQFLEANPDAFAALGEPGEPGLIEGFLNCTSAAERFCFREFGNFKRDPGVQALRNATAEGGAGAVAVPAGGTRQAGAPDPLLGLDIFFASNLSLKNNNFRTARCGECHAVPTLTDHTVPFTFKGQLRDFVAEFLPGQPGNEAILEPLGRLRVISGFLLESEFNENGQDAVERRIANQSIVPCPTDGLAYPGGLEGTPGGLVGVAPACNGAAAGYFDNGVYNLGVRPISEDVGRGGTDAFGWPLSLAVMMMKNLGGVNYNPGGDNPTNGFAQPAPPGIPLPTFDPAQGPTGGLFEESAQDQQLNPGFEGNPVNPLLPPYLASFANQINVGDSAPELDEPFSGLNTLTDIAMLEGFLDTLGPFNPAGVLNESLNMGETALMGTWPNVNRVSRMGSFKAPQLRNVELTGPYFHNGGLATLRQVVDFYVRGGDFPITNAGHRDFNLVNMNIEVQSNLTEEEKVALVDFLLELTDERNRFDRAPFDHPQVIIPVDGTAPDNTLGRGALLADSRFRDIKAVGAAGRPAVFDPADPFNTGPGQPFLNITKQRLVGPDAFTVKNSHYSH